MLETSPWVFVWAVVGVGAICFIASGVLLALRGEEKYVFLAALCAVLGVTFTFLSIPGVMVADSSCSSQFLLEGGKYRAMVTEIIPRESGDIAVVLVDRRITYNTAATDCYLLSASVFSIPPVVSIEWRDMTVARAGGFSAIEVK